MKKRPSFFHCRDWLYDVGKLVDNRSGWLRYMDHLKFACTTNRKEIEKIAKDEWNKIYIDREKEINLIADMINDLNNKKVDLFVNVNNHFEGSAPLTIKRIRNALE